MGSHGYETQDAQTFASWGVDFVMNDGCWIGAIHDPKSSAEMGAIHQKLAQALRATGRPIVYKIHGAINVLGKPVAGWDRNVGANLWRVSPDLCEGERWKSVSLRFERHGEPEEAGPGGWNDADNLVIGLNGIGPGYRGATPGYAPLTLDESRTPHDFAVHPSFAVDSGE